MTSENESNAQASAGPVNAIKAELEKANVSYENVFVRREELVIVLPGRGAERQAALDAASKVELHGRHYVSIMAEHGAPASARMVLAVVVFVIGVFGALLMVWGYLGALHGDSRAGNSESPAQNDDSGR